jgi:hypothetical protein
VCVREVEVEGRRISWSGFAKRASSCAAVWDLGERARFFVGRLERGSAEVGMLSGMGSDIVMVLCGQYGFCLDESK